MGRGCVCGPGGIRSVCTSGPLLESCLALHVTGPAWESPSQRRSGDGDGGAGGVSDIWYFFVLPIWDQNGGSILSQRLLWPLGAGEKGHVTPEVPPPPQAWSQGLRESKCPLRNIGVLSGLLPASGPSWRKANRILSFSLPTIPVETHPKTIQGFPTPLHAP